MLTPSSLSSLSLMSSSSPLTSSSVNSATPRSPGSLLTSSISPVPAPGLQLPGAPCGPWHSSARSCVPWLPTSPSSAPAGIHGCETVIHGKACTSEGSAVTLASSPDGTAGLSPLSLRAPPSCCLVASAGFASPSLPVPVHPLHWAGGEDVGRSRAAVSGELLLAHVTVFCRTARSSLAP